MRPRREGVVWAVCVTAACLATGCVAGKTPADRIYRLEPALPEARFERPPLAGTLEVDRLAGDSLTRARYVLYARPDSNEVKPYPYDLWSDSPTLLLQQRLVEPQRAAGLAEQVVTPDMGAEEDWVVSGRLLRLDHLAGAGVQVEVELWLTDIKRRRLLLRQTYRVRAGEGATDVADAIPAFAAALEQIFARFTSEAAAAAAG